VLTSPSNPKSPFEIIQEKAWDTCTPINVTLELTLKCNIRCIHCYNFDRTQKQKRDLTNELSTPRIHEVIDEISEVGTLFISFSGGEALLHPDLNTFIEHARKNHLGAKVKSNGILLTKARLESLLESGLTDLDISLYGASPQTHDAFTLSPGSYQKTVEGILKSAELGIKPNLSLIAHRRNIHEIDQMIAFAKEHSLPFGVSTALSARYDGTHSSLDERLDEKDLHALYQGKNGALFYNHFNPTGGVQCNCARTTAGISAEGEVYPCIGAPVPCGNLKTASFQEIWKNSKELNRIRGLTLKDFEDCGDCSLRYYCKRSSGDIYTNTGNYTGKDDWFCKEARLTKTYREASPSS